MTPLFPCRPAGSVSGAVSAGAVEDEVFENERFARSATGAAHWSADNLGPQDPLQFAHMLHESKVFPSVSAGSQHVQEEGSRPLGAAKLGRRAGAKSVHMHSAPLPCPDWLACARVLAPKCSRSRPRAGCGRAPGRSTAAPRRTQRAGPMGQVRLCCQTAACLERCFTQASLCWSSSCDSILHLFLSNKTLCTLPCRLQVPPLPAAAGKAQAHFLRLLPPPAVGAPARARQCAAVPRGSSGRVCRGQGPGRCGCAGAASTLPRAAGEPGRGCRAVAGAAGAGGSWRGAGPAPGVERPRAPAAAAPCPAGQQRSGRRCRWRGSGGGGRGAGQRSACCAWLEPGLRRRHLLCAAGRAAGGHHAPRVLPRSGHLRCAPGLGKARQLRQCVSSCYTLPHSFSLHPPPTPASPLCLPLPPACSPRVCGQRAGGERPVVQPHRGFGHPGWQQAGAAADG